MTDKTDKTYEEIIDRLSALDANIALLHRDLRAINKRLDSICPLDAQAKRSSSASQQRIIDVIIA